MSQYTSLKEVIGDIQKQVEERNARLDDGSIPFSDEFLSRFARRAGLAPDKMEELMNIMANANMIFIIEVVKADRAKKIGLVEGYVIPRGDLIGKLRDKFESDLAKLYAVEFNVSISPSRVVREMEGRLDEYNNSRLGRIGRIAYKLGHFQKNLEWNISRYNPREQEKELDTLLAMSPDLQYFMTPGTAAAADQKEAPRRRAMDGQQFEEFESYSRKNSLERTLAVYGVEFFCRVCFRDYKFSLIKKIIDDGLVKKEDDLYTVKKLLQRERSNADRDMKIQEYANEINILEKSINERLKKNT